jgi:hypothetical protein
MPLFCPEGYVPVQEAIGRAAQSWFPEQKAALETATASELAMDNKPSDDVNALTPVERLADAFRGQPSISQKLRQQFLDLQTKTEDRLRKPLHRDVLTAYYFGGQGLRAVPREFWATTEADGVLMSGSYWPFGKPRAWHEQRPSYPLFFLESQLATLLSEDPKSPRHLRQAGNRRGRKPTKLEQVKQAMRHDFSQGSELQNMREKELAAKYGVSRDTARKARDAVVPKIVDDSILDK